MRLYASGLLAFAALELTGCASVEKALNRIPQISASEMHLEHSDPLGSTQINIVGLVETPEQATADLVVVQISVPFFGTTSVTLKKYVRKKNAVP